MLKPYPFDSEPRNGEGVDKRELVLYKKEGDINESVGAGQIFGRGKEFAVEVAFVLRRVDDGLGVTPMLLGGRQLVFSQRFSCANQAWSESWPCSGSMRHRVREGLVWLRCARTEFACEIEKRSGFFRTATNCKSELSVGELDRNT